ncbi:MAG: hypothetical protein L0312_19735 [Acidobacteria bacterium]|nr:hypothetical protein [Acidobacteriota bacterium]
MIVRNPIRSRHRSGLFVGLSLFLVATACLQIAISQEQEFCYQIQLDGRDRSVFQYVSRNFLVFSDPSWTTNPAVKTVRWVETKAGTPLPQILPANLRAGGENPWGGIKLSHLPPGQEFRLELDGKPAVLKRVSASGSTCPRVDLLLDGRWRDYEVLQQRANSFGTHTVGCHLEILGEEVLLALPSLENIRVELLNSPKLEVVKFRRYDRLTFIQKYPQLKQRAERLWGITSLYLIFPPLKPGEELKISGDTLGQRVSFFVRRIGKAL